MLIQNIAATGRTVYVFIWNALGQVYNTATTAFESYTSSNWANYAISAPEQAGSGTYFATVPSALTTPGSYTWSGYLQMGASPASGDTAINEGNFMLGNTTPIISSSPTALIQVVEATGQHVYAFIWNAAGQIWNNTSSAFETYTSAHWSNYLLLMTEKPGTGSYFLTTPTGIATSGIYSWSAYVGTGVVGDTVIGEGSFTIGITITPPTVPSNLAPLITSLRILCEDYADNKLIDGEMVGGTDTPWYPVNGSNQTFQLKNRPLADVGTLQGGSGSPIFTWLTIIGTGGVVRSQTGFTVIDQINGIVSISTPPNPGSATPGAGVYFSYNYLDYSDTKYAEWLSEAAQLTVAGTTDPTTVPVGLSQAMLQYAVWLYAQARQAWYARQYDSSAGDERQSAQSRAKQYSDLAKQALAAANALKTDYYKRQGQREAPVVIIQSYPGLTPITPRR